jgi:lipopolysaccharide export system protein LptA
MAAILTIAFWMTASLLFQAPTMAAGETIAPSEGAATGEPGEPMSEEDPPINLIAEEVGYDKAKGLYVARGNVELLRGEKIVMADV